MATLEKLGILGIRSFSPDSLEVLAFEKPLTLIVGHNGAGKTTVVECLKMATTGELPPSAGKGKNFIHNPKVADVPEVKGQIRLVFRTSNDKKILANRSFQLSTTRDRKGKIKTSFKALESVLQVKDSEGVIRSINKKCAQMDQQVPQLMGVSRAILENVVFCHQEESNWPLEEMAKLKKKFDDIFGATRYSKALEAITALRKDHQKIAKEKQHQMELMRTYVDQALTLREKIAQAKSKNERFTAQLESLSLELKNEQDALDEAKARLETLRESEMQLELRTRALESLQTNVDTLRADVSQDSEYTRKGAAELETDRTSLTDGLQAEKIHLESIRSDISCLESRFQQITSQKETLELSCNEAIRCEERLRSLKQTKLETVGRLVNGYLRRSSTTAEADTLLETLETEDSTAILADLERRKQVEIGATEKRLDEEREAISLNLRTIRQECFTLTADEAKLQSTIESLKRRIEDVDHFLNQENEVREALTSVVQEAAETRRQCASSANGPDLLTLQDELTQLRLTRKKLQDDVEAAVVATQIKPPHSNDQHILQTPGVERYSLDAQCHAARCLYKRCFKKDIPESRTWDTAFMDVTDALVTLDRLSETERKRSLLHCATEAKISLVLQRRQRLECERETLREALKQPDIPSAEVETVLKSQRAQVEASIRKLVVAHSAQKLYTNHLQHSLDSNKCAFCTRTFDTESQRNAMKSHMESRLISLPRAIEQQQQSLDTAKRQVESLERLQETVLALRLLETSLTDTAEEQRRLETDLARSDAELADARAAWASERPQQSLLLQLKAYVDAIRTTANHRSTTSIHDNTLASSQTDDDSDTSDQSSAYVTAVARLHEVHQKLKELDASIELVEASISAKRVEEEAQRTQLAELASREASLRLKETRFDEMQANKTEAAEVLKVIKTELATLAPRIAAVRAQCQSLQDELDAHQNRTHATLHELRGDVEAIRTAQRSLADIKREQQEGDASLQRLRASMESMKLLTDTIKDTTTELQAKRDLRMSTEKKVDEFQRHLVLLERVIRLQAKENELSAAKKSLDEFRNFCYEQTAKPAELRKTIAALSTTITSLTTKIGTITGEQKSNNEWRSQHEGELMSSKYKDIDNRHRSALVETETECMAIRDLHRYHTALDKALMKYHTVKMQNINRTIRELWQTVYKGRDIDYIMIRSDTDEELQFATTGQRSYNYRVMMVKDGCCELEMRGRCSAGQKVLASIVIRLALAESFGVNCGILALDEPTTNLDRNNMDGLARALADLIASRRHCANFQLILITHDEEFVRMLSRHQPCDSFFQVSKDQEGYSVIRRADIRNF